MSEDSKHNDLQKIITQSLEEMKREQGMAYRSWQLKDS